MRFGGDGERVELGFWEGWKRGGLKKWKIGILGFWLIELRKGKMLGL